MLVMGLLLGCGDDSSTDAGADAGADSTVDVGSTDSGDDVGSDAAGEDAAPDPDAGRDAAIDAPPGTRGSVRFRGQGDTLGERIQIRLDDPDTVEAGPIIDVGAGDFTIELWLRPGDNPNEEINCGSTNEWVDSNIFVDRDRHSQPPHFGAGIAGGVVVWSVGNEFNTLTMCGTTNILDDAWHHVALQRRASDGRMWIWIDGALDAMDDGPEGDISYPDDGVPLMRCPERDGVCDYSDPFLVFGAEKHGYADISYTGLMDEIRVSSTLRYMDGFTPSTSEFVTDANTVALYHLNETGGEMVRDDSGNDQHATAVYAGDPVSPTWEMESAL